MTITLLKEVNPYLKLKTIQYLFLIVKYSTECIFKAAKFSSKQTFKGRTHDFINTKRIHNWYQSVMRKLKIKKR